MSVFLSSHSLNSAKACVLALLCGLLTACGGSGSTVPKVASTDTTTTDDAGTGGSNTGTTATTGTGGTDAGGSGPGPATDAPPGTMTDTVVPSVIETSTVQFLPYDLVSGFSYCYGFSIHDYDKDGKPDLSVFDSWVNLRSDVRPTPGAIGYIRWNTAGFQKIVPLEKFDYSASPVTNVYLFERHVAADINHDGWDDIVGVVNSHDSVLAYMNPGNRTSSWARRVLSNNTPGAVNLTVADINNDGQPDVFVSMRLQYTASFPAVRAGIAWLENTGSATGPWTYHTIDTSDYFQDTRTVQAGDINKDGKLDVLVSDTITGKVAWYEQVAADVWTRHEIPDINTAGAHFGKLLDFDGDGLLDIVMPTTTGVVLLTNVNKGESWKSQIIAQFPSKWNGQVTEVAVGDIDGDGLLDVVFSVVEPTPDNPNAGGVYWASRKGSEWHLYRLYSGASKATEVQLVDYDGDGRLDVAVNREYESQGVTLWLNKGLVTASQ